MKRYYRKKDGIVTNGWDDNAVDCQGRRGIHYREPSFGEEGTFEIIEEEDHAERIAKFRAFKEKRDLVKAETFAGALEDFVLETTPPYTKKQLRDYKKALKESIDPFKNWREDAEAAARLDELVIENYVWPVLGE